MSKAGEPEVCLRKGKWTVEEETYANYIIELFNQGRLPIEEGITLRSYLSDKLQCDPMRITKKYAGESSIGKQVFHPSVNYNIEKEALEEVEDRLETLERAFLKKICAKKSSTADEEIRPSMRSQRHREKPAEYADYYTAEKLDSLEVFGESVGGQRRRRDSSSSNLEQLALNHAQANQTPLKPSSISIRSVRGSKQDLTEYNVPEQLVNEGDEEANDYGYEYDHHSDDSVKKGDMSVSNKHSPSVQAGITDEQKHASHRKQSVKSNKYNSTLGTSMKASRRSFSAPNLSALEQSNQMQRNAQLMSLLSGLPALDVNSPHENQYLSHIPSFSLQSLMQNNNINSSHNFGSSALHTNEPISLRKRSHSSMALMDFEKLVKDDEAADSLFMEFVSNIQETKRNRTQSQAQENSNRQEDNVVDTNDTNSTARNIADNKNSTVPSLNTNDSSTNWWSDQQLPPSTLLTQPSPLNVMGNTTKMIVQPNQWPVANFNTANNHQDDSTSHNNSNNNKRSSDNDRNKKQRPKRVQGHTSPPIITARPSASGDQLFLYHLPLPIPLLSASAMFTNPTNVQATTSTTTNKALPLNELMHYEAWQEQDISNNSSSSRENSDLHLHLLSTSNLIVQQQVPQTSTITKPATIIPSDDEASNFF